MRRIPQQLLEVELFLQMSLDILALVPVSVPLLENKILADLSKLKLYLIRMGLASTMINEQSSMKQGFWTKILREEGYVRTETKVVITCLLAKGCQLLLWTTRSYRKTWNKLSLITPDFWPPELLQNEVLFLNPPFCGSYNIPQETNTITRLLSCFTTMLSLLSIEQIEQRTEPKCMISLRCQSNNSQLISVAQGICCLLQSHQVESGIIAGSRKRAHSENDKLSTSAIVGMDTKVVGAMRVKAVKQSTSGKRQWSVQADMRRPSRLDKVQTGSKKQGQQR